MLDSSQVQAFASIVNDAYICGEVPEGIDSLSFYHEAMLALERATANGEDGEPILNDFAEKYLHLGQS